MESLHLQLQSSPTKYLQIRSRVMTLFFKRMFVFVCVFVCKSVISLHYIFEFAFLHGRTSILTFSHTVGKWEADSQETPCWIHTIWKTRRKKAGLTLRSIRCLWRQLRYQPSFLYWLIVARQIQPTRIWIKNCQVCVVDIYETKAKKVWASLALKMWKMRVYLMPNNHSEQIETLWTLDQDFVLYNIRNNIACFVWSSCCRFTDYFEFNWHLSRVKKTAKFTPRLLIKTRHCLS